MEVDMRERERESEGAVQLALKMGGGTKNQGVQVTSRN